MRRLWFRSGLAVILLAAVAAGYYWLRPAKPRTTVVPYSIATVTNGDLRRAVLTTGQLTPLVSVEVSTQISGQITEVMVDFNTPVKKGQILARIDPSTYEQKLKQAQADLAAAEASHTLAKLTADRQQQLLSRAMVTQQDNDQAAAQLQQAEATLLTRRAAVENAQVDLDRCTLRSPIDGVVIYKSADVGKTVQASFSAPTLFVIAEDLRRMQIIAAVSEVDIWSVHPGQEVTFTVEALPDRTFHGRLQQIRNPYTPSDKQSTGPTTANSITTFDAVIEVDNTDQVLLPSLTANISIIVTERPHVLRLPNSALRVSLGLPVPPKPAGAERATDLALVYRLPHGDRTAPPESVWIRLGVTDSITTEIVSGLNPGDTVITGIGRVRDGRGRMGLF